MWMRLVQKQTAGVHKRWDILIQRGRVECSVIGAFHRAEAEGLLDELLAQNPGYAHAPACPLPGHERDTW